MSKGHKKELCFVVTDRAGVYYCDSVLQQWIIHPDELELIPENYPLLALSRGKKLSQFIQCCLEENEVNYLQLVLDIGLLTDPEVIWNKIKEIRQMPQTISESTWPLIDEFLRTSPEAVAKLSTIRKAQEKGEKKGEKNIFKKLLSQHFSPLPRWIDKYIEKATEKKILIWINNIFTAKSIEEVFGKK